jgi:hypothetical protein
LRKTEPILEYSTGLFRIPGLNQPEFNAYNKIMTQVQPVTLKPPFVAKCGSETWAPMPVALKLRGLVPATLQNPEGAPLMPVGTNPAYWMDEKT